MSKPGIPQGTRDFSPHEVRKRQYIFKTLQNIFETYGFQPLETPAMENLNTLMGKYGEEGDRLIFKILNNGLNNPDKFEKTKAAFERVLEGKSTADFTERALRYDLTIPFARYVVMHQNELAFPFRRYQMQPVWRADRPQRGRYREFWQCDCDVVGSNSLINEAELLCIYQSAFHQLRIPGITLKINSRKLLAGLSEVAGMPEKMMEITIALDKLDKIGWDGVTKELQDRGISQQGIIAIEKIISVAGSNEDKLAMLENIMQTSEIGLSGINELKQTIQYHNSLKSTDWHSTVAIDISLARGLNYYTGIIVEVTTDAVKMGSIGGGGRYDDLTGLFGLKNLSGVGISFGIDRIYDVMEELDLFPEASAEGTQVLIINEKETDESFAFEIIKLLRNNKIRTEIYPDRSKFEKQIKYADKNNINITLIPGNDGKITVRNFRTNTKIESELSEIIFILKKQLNEN